MHATKFSRVLLSVSRLGIARFRSHTFSSSSMELKVEKIDSGAIIRMSHGENRVTPDFVKAMHNALDTVESFEDAKYVITIGEGKYYSLGFDLDLYATMDMLDVFAALHDVQKLLARMLTFPLVTVSAINGHAYAAGLFLPLTNDYRVMRTERGWLCLPETNIKAVFTSGLMKFLKACIPQPEHHKAIVLGKRYTSEEAKAVGIIDEVCPLSELESKAIAAGNRLAGEDGLDRKTLAANKHILYQDCYTALLEPIHLPLIKAI